MRESAIEKYLCQRVAAIGGVCEKHVSPGLRGVPDQLVTWHDGRMFLCELKAPKGRTSGLQRKDHKRRARLGVKVWICHTLEQVDAFIAWLEVTT